MPAPSQHTSYLMALVQEMVTVVVVVVQVPRWGPT